MLTVADQRFFPSKSLHFFDIDSFSQEGKLEFDRCEDVKCFCSVGGLEIWILVLWFWFWFRFRFGEWGWRRGL